MNNIPVSGSSTVYYSTTYDGGDITSMSAMCTTSGAAFGKLRFQACNSTQAPTANSQWAFTSASVVISPNSTAFSAYTFIAARWIRLVYTNDVSGPSGFITVAVHTQGLT